MTPLPSVIFRLLEFGRRSSTVAARLYSENCSGLRSTENWLAIQFSLFFGILRGFMSILHSHMWVKRIWRWWWVWAFPASIYTLFVLTVPEKPKMALTKNRTEEAQKKICIPLDQSCPEELESWNKPWREVATDSENIFMKNIDPTWHGFLIAFFNQILWNSRISITLPDIWKCSIRWKYRPS